MASVHYHLKLNPINDEAVIARINAQANKNDYIRNLVISDIAADALRPLLRPSLADPDPEDPADDKL